MENDYHEKETIRLSASESKSRRDLHAFLKGRGFKSEDEFYFIDRLDTPKPWQAISVMTVNVFNQGSAVYETDEDVAEKPSEWDELKVDYLLATLPVSFIEKCADECETIAAKFDLTGGQSLKNTGGQSLKIEFVRHPRSASALEFRIRANAIFRNLTDALQSMTAGIRRIRCPFPPRHFELDPGDEARLDLGDGSVSPLSNPI